MGIKVSKHCQNILSSPTEPSLHFISYEKNLRSKENGTFSVIFKADSNIWLQLSLITQANKRRIFLIIFPEILQKDFIPFTARVNNGIL